MTPRRTTNRFVVAAAGVALALPLAVAAADAPLDEAATAARPAHRGPAAAATAPIDPDVALVDAAFATINAERARHGLPAFGPHHAVQLAAQAHADHLAALGALVHSGPGGSDAGDRLHTAGLAWSTWGENLAAGFGTADSVVAAWLASPAHRGNLLGAFEHLGLAVARSADGTPYWVMVTAT